MILGIKTDQPQAELFLHDAKRVKDELTWTAGRELSDTLLIKISDLLDNNSLTLRDISSVVVFKGPGSFTGLRIGITVANTLAYSLNIPIVGSKGSDWLNNAIDQIKSNQDFKSISPIYGSPVNITKQKK